MKQRANDTMRVRRLRAVSLCTVVLTLLVTAGAYAQTSLRARAAGTVNAVVFKDSETGPQPDQAVLQRLQQQFTGTEWAFALQGDGLGAITIGRGGQALYPKPALFLAADTQLTRMLFHYGDPTQVLNGEVFRNPQNLKQGAAIFYVVLLPTPGAGGGFGGGFGGSSGGGFATSAYLYVPLEFE
jgi:hypothetical protein